MGRAVKSYWEGVAVQEGELRIGVRFCNQPTIVTLRKSSLLFCEALLVFHSHISFFSYLVHMVEDDCCYHLPLLCVHYSRR